MSRPSSPWRRRALAVLAALLALVALAAAAGAYVWGRQGLDPSELSAVPQTQVEVDAWGVPTISGPDWGAVIEAQGFVTASERLWQMELTRRSASGGLSELFGEAAIEADKRRLTEDWQGTAQALAAALPPDEAEICERYASGVNRFIRGRRGRWGIEFALLRFEPRPWTCADSMLVMLAMARDLSSASEDEANEARWREALDPEWQQLLFPVDHPWNHPLFGENPHRTHLPSTPLAPSSPAPSAPGDAPMTPGSNSWAWRGATGAFLANDPHLGANVPHLWYMVRLRLSERDWVVGVSAPGLPLVVLGMNPALAWGFTNVGEDVDDLLLETVSPDGARYLVSRTPDALGGEPTEVWAPIERREHTLRVKGQEPQSVVSLHTARGPLQRRSALDGAWASRAWLPFQDPAKVAHLAMLGCAKARTVTEIEAAIGRFRFPAQNVLVVTRAGDIVYQASGLGVVRTVDGGRPEPALEGAWLGLEPPSARHRLELLADAPDPAWIATANARIWVDGDAGDASERWASDRRVERIRTALAGKTDLSREDMERLQMDTTSRYHQILLEWVAARHPPADDGEAAMMRRWASWDGVAATAPQTFTEALAVEATLRDSLVDAVRRARLPAAFKQIPYYWSRDDAMILLTLGLPNDDSSETAVDWGATNPGFDRFGLVEAEVAQAAARAASAVVELYPVTNRWTAQHPFVNRVPLIGAWFEIASPEQAGYPNLVRTEKPRAGASARLVWDLRDPASSTWITPVGQSGHVRSPHYADLQPRYHADQRLPVFDTAHGWGFGG